MHNLRTDIEARFGSVHRFCRLHPFLNRATVYMVLAGKYGGNIERQTRRIRDALEGQDDEKRIMETIKTTACARCSVTGECSRCDALFTAQAKAVTQLFSR
ncbi:hypothetical protein [Pseudodesulfovibrio methanolicus]|uniref:Transposase DDE domain-containing protein n=1 Tax=Pseudodesulfovibrio methanolicus TaxID=3126690 RepID=A0ABZ2J189_9BACT